MPRPTKKNLVRRAVHAGDWYDDSPDTLRLKLNNWLDSAGQPVFSPARAIISPHAGYEYSGSCAAHAFKEIDPNIVKRIFILGPSHWVRLGGCALSPATTYETPIGNLNIDQDIYEELYATTMFEEMTIQSDEKEHSMEMQLPYIVRIMEKRNGPYTIVPVMVGSLTFDKEQMYGKIFSKYLADRENAFVISSDFCHWGQGFQYQFYDKSWGQIYQSIERLDKIGMQTIKELEPTKFSSYIRKYGNTICGRHPIGVMISAAHELNQDSRYWLKFLNYAQSKQCRQMYETSVSYVAGSLKEFENKEDRPKQPIVDVTDEKSFDRV